VGMQWAACANRLRRPVDRGVVYQVERLSHIVSTESWFDPFLRTLVFPSAIKLPFLRARQDEAHRHWLRSPIAPSCTRQIRLAPVFAGQY
jgi:hypothetical protein